MMKSYFKYVPGFLLMFFVMGCTSIFIEDPIDPRLPKYTETGNNVAGAFIDQETWVSRTSIWGRGDYPEIMRYSENDSLVIVFFGTSDSISTNFVFVLRDVELNSFQEIIALEGVKFSLDGTKDQAILIKGSERLDHGKGQIFFKNISLDEESDAAIISGTFGFEVQQRSKPVKVSYGRFDFRITSEYFRLF